jgi:hypothetical protein
MKRKKIQENGTDWMYYQYFRYFGCQSLSERCNFVGIPCQDGRVTSECNDNIKGRAGKSSQGGISILFRRI